MNVIARISCYLERGVVTLKLCKEYLNTVTHNTSFLLWIKQLYSLIHAYTPCPEKNGTTSILGITLTNRNI